MISSQELTKSRPQGSGFFIPRVNTLLVFAFIVWLASVVLGYFASLKTEDLAFSSFFDSKAAELSQSLKAGNEHNLVQASRNTRLSWLFATRADGEPTSFSARNLIPRGLSFDPRSRFVDYSDNSFYDAVIPLKSRLLLHIGFKTGPRHPSLGADFPAVFVLVWMLWSGLFVSCGIAICIAGPLKRLVDLALAGLEPENEARKLLKASIFAPAELNRLIPAFKTMFQKYDASVAEQKSLREELERLRASNESLRQEMHELVQKSHQNLSEFTSRESEETLLRLIDAQTSRCQSSVEVCQRSLDLISERFPGSLKYIAIFLPKADGEYKLESYLGLDVLSLNRIKTVENKKLFEHVFARDAVTAMESEDLDNFGWYECVRAAGLEAALFVPIANKGQELAMLTVFFDTSTKDLINDRRRVLQRVQELLAHILYRLKLLQSELTAARTDALTGLYNKKFFQEAAASLLEKSQGRSPLSFLLLDGDHFKNINDTYGHQAGDAMLKCLAEMMLENTRHSDQVNKGKRERDYVIRWGGEEFLIIMEGTNADVAGNIAERLRRTVSEKKDWPAGVEKWSLSIGMSSFPADGATLEELIEKADIALYHCKNTGRNKVIAYGELPDKAQKTGVKGV